MGRRGTLSRVVHPCAVIAAFCFAIVPCGLAKDSVAQLAERLASADREVRREASYELARLGADAKDAVPALIKALDDPDKQVWSNAVTAIANIGPAAKEAIPALLDDLNSRKSRGGREREKRQALLRSAYALTRIGPAAVPALITALSADEISSRQGAARALGGMGPAAREAVSALSGNLGHPDADLRHDVIEALAIIGQDSIKPLTDALGSKEPLQRESAALVLAQLGPAAKETAPPLLQMLQTEREPAVRAAVLSALSRVGLEPDRAVPLLIDGLKSDNETLRHAATNALLSMHSVQPIAVPELARMLRETNAAASQRAAYVLGRYGSAAASAVPALVEFASQQEPPPAPLVEALTQIGAPAVPEILASVRGQNPDTLSREHWTVHCLAAIGSPAVPAISEALTSPSVPVRLLAARACGEIAVDAAAAGPALLKACGDSDPRVRAAALGAAVATRMDAAQLLPHFESAFKDAVPIVRMTAVQLVPYLGTEGQALDPALIAALKDDAAMVRLAALQAVGPATPEAVPVIMESLGDPALQPKIIDALAKIGAAAEPAVPRLLELLPTAPKETRLKILAVVAIIGSQAGLPALVHAMKDDDAEIRSAAIAGYAKAEQEPAAVLAAAVAMLNDPNREVRRAAASALAQLGDGARGAAPQLIVLLDSDEDRAFALETLRRTQPRAVPQILPLLNHRDEGVRVFACERLGRLGADAREAIPALQQLAGAQSQPESVQREARRALRQIEQK